MKNVSNDSDYDDEFDCSYQMPFLPAKVVLVLGVGTTTAVLSLLFNSVLFGLLAASPSLRRTHFFYLTFLALCDIAVALSYLALMTVQILMEYYESKNMSAVWHYYLKFFFALSHVSMAVATYLIIAATIERYIGSRKRWVVAELSTRRRFMGVCLSLALGVIFKGSTYWEIKVYTIRHCDNQNYYAAAHTDLARNPLYKSIWMIWMHLKGRNLGVVFIPFFLLAFLNYSIMKTLRHRHQMSISTEILKYSSPASQRELQITSSREGKKAVQASRMTVVIVCSYLLTNVLNVIITAWEYFDNNSLYANYHMFYALSSDIVSLLTVVSGLIRLPVYAWSNYQIRHELENMGKWLIVCWTGKPRISRIKSSISTPLLFDQSSRSPSPNPITPQGSWRASHVAVATEEDSGVLNGGFKPDIHLSLPRPVHRNLHSPKRDTHITLRIVFTNSDETSL